MLRPVAPPTTNAAAARRSPPLAYNTVAFLLLNHLGAVAAFWWFTPRRGLVALALYVAAGLGITLGYHRLLAHRSFRTSVWFERALAVLGTLAMEGGPVGWVASHRLHHTNADEEGDPHDISRGLWFAHVGWILASEPESAQSERRRRFARDLARIDFYNWLERYHYAPTLGLLASLVATGGPGLALWGICLRITVGHHATWCVNSVCHRLGQRPYPNYPGTNNLFVALVTMGEGWHNNHHAYPGSARHGRGREFDLSGIVLGALQRVGVVWAVRDELPRAALNARGSAR